jgi:hypothetical protein
MKHACEVWGIWKARPTSSVMKQAPEDPLAEIDRFAYLEDLAILHGARFAGVLPARAETLVRRAKGACETGSVMP